MDLYAAIAFIFYVIGWICCCVYYAREEVDDFPMFLLDMLGASFILLLVVAVWPAAVVAGSIYWWVNR